MVGAGFSLNAEPLAGARSRFPVWRELARAMFEGLPPRISDTEESRERRFASANPLRIASEYEAAFGQRKLELLIRERIPDLDHQPGGLHRLLLQLPWADVFTTNYDTLLERTEVNGRAYQPVTKSSELTTAFAPRIVKLHGTLPMGPLILSEEDYRTYPRKFAPFVNCVRESLLENSFVLIGFSGDDPNFLEWTGWIRDELGQQHAPIYLVGAFSFGNVDRTLLDRRGVTPIDLAPVVGDDPPGGVHAASIEWFLASLLAGREFWHGDWPDLKRRSPRLTPGLPEVVDSGAAIPASLEWPPTTHITNEDVAKVMERWRFERAEYPGWVVAPENKRSRLWQSTKSLYLRLTEAVKDWAVEDRILVLREINWRFEAIMLPLPADAIGEFQRTVDEIFDVVVQERLRPGQNVIDAWFEVALGLQRDARESYDTTPWNALNTKINTMAVKHKADADRIQYEAALWDMWNLDRQSARQILSRWQPSPASPAVNVRKASLLAELGDVGEARSVLRSALSEVRRSLRLRPSNIELLSLEGWCMYLLAIVEPALDLSTYRDVGEEFKERWQELRLWDCDPWDYKAFFDTVLSSTAPKLPQLEERIPGFDPGTATVSRNFAWDLIGPLQPAFACIRLYEQVGIPVCLPMVKVSGNTLANASRWIAPFMGFLSPALFIRARRADFLAQRSQAASLDAPVAGRLYTWCLEVLNRELASLKAPIPMGSTEESLLDVLAEVLSKLAFKVSERELRLTLPVALRFHQHPGVRSHPRLNRSCDPWFGRLFLAAEATLLTEWLPILTRAPLPDEGPPPGIPVGYWSPDAMQRFPGTRLRQQDVSGDALHRIQDATEWLLMRAKSESGEGRWRAVIRLIHIHATDLMLADQQRRFGELLWERRNAKGLPDLHRFPLGAFLNLPAPLDVDTQAIIKRYVLTMPPGGIVTRGATGRLSIAVGGEERTFIHEASAVSRPVIALAREELNGVQWTQEEAKQLYLKAQDWWTNDSEALKGDAFPPMGGVDSVRDTASRLGQFLSRIVLPKMETASEDDRREVITWLAELRTAESFPTLALPYVLLHRPMESASVEKTIAQDIGSDNKHAVAAAVEALRHWVHLSAIKGVPGIPPNLITTLVERVALRRKPGITSCLVQLTRLIVERPAAITLSHATLLSAALIPWHEATISIGDEGGPRDFSDPELSDLRVCVGQLAGALRIWYLKTSPGVPEPAAISKWEDFCASDTLPEVRRAFTACEQIEHVQPQTLSAS